MKPDHPTGRILLVEDDEVVAALLMRIAQPYADVHWYSNAEAALTIAAETTWDLVIADIGLPGMNGLEFVHAFKKAQPFVATLVLAANRTADNDAGTLPVNADDFITKPIDPAAFVQRIRELMGLTAARISESREVVLAIGAHPEDVEIGCGGILLRHVARGDGVHLLTLTGAEKGEPPVAHADGQRRAAKLIGARLIQRDLWDAHALTGEGEGEGDATIDAIRAVIGEIRPDVIYTHSDHDSQQDHRSVHRATLAAAPGVPRIYCYQSPSTTVDFRPTRFVAIDAFVDRKVEVIGAYGSRVKVRRLLAEDVLRATVRYWSRFGQSAYAEPLEVIRDSDDSGGSLGAVGEQHAGPQALEHVR